MNTVFLIGNGFDRNLGMLTEYKHFYNYYLSNQRDEDSIHIKELKDTIAENTDNWSDLEFALGNYLSRIEASDAVTLHDHLLIHLSTYLASEEEKYILDPNQLNTLLNYLQNPIVHAGLLNSETTELNNHLSEIRQRVATSVKIITFNYTKSIERFGFDTSAIEHIHGFTNERMILGVNDISQISNEKLHEETSVIDRYVKSACNGTYGVEHDKKCSQWIDQAHLICLFGLSFGDTDKQWWIKIGEALLRGCRIIIFEYNPNETFNGNQGPHKKAAKEAVKDRFLFKTNLGDGHKEIVRNQIYIAHNTDMFKFDVAKKTESNKKSNNLTTK